MQALSEGVSQEKGGEVNRRAAMCKMAGEEWVAAPGAYIYRLNVRGQLGYRARAEAIWHSSGGGLPDRDDYEIVPECVICLGTGTTAIQGLVCGHCHGTGIEPEKKPACTQCKGIGTWSGNPVWPCPHCDGVGVEPQEKAAEADEFPGYVVWPIVPAYNGQVVKAPSGSETAFIPAIENLLSNYKAIGVLMRKENKS